MTDTTDRAKVADDEYERFLEEMSEQIDRATFRRARQVRTRRAAAASLALVAVIAGAVLAASGGRGRLDVVAEAKAALAPSGQIVALTTTSHLELRKSSRTELTGSEAESLGWNKPRVAEQWSATAPARWRIATTRRISTGHGVVSNAPVQCVYSHGREETYYASLGNELLIVPVSKGKDQAAEESSCTFEGPSLGTQPLARIDSLLRSGRLKPAGTAVVSGRVVLRLTGYETLPRGVSAAAAAWPVEYDVDPKTYAPVRLTVEMIGASTLGNPGTLTEVIDVTNYETLPLNSMTEGLLRIKSTGVPVVRHGVNEYERRERTLASGAVGNSRLRRGR